MVYIFNAQAIVAILHSTQNALEEVISIYTQKRLEEQ